METIPHTFDKQFTLQLLIYQLHFYMPLINCLTYGNCKISLYTVNSAWKVVHSKETNAEFSVFIKLIH